MTTKIECTQLKGREGLTIYQVEKDALHSSPSPLLIYFSIGGEESLVLDPFNQPIAFLHDTPIQTISFDLPGHGPGYDKMQAMRYWADKVRSGEPIIGAFIEKVRHNIDWLIEEGIADPNRIGVAGLSRGGFVATHLASIDPRIQTILGFAPVTSLSRLREFQDIDIDPSLDLLNLCQSLTDKSLAFFIGNHDRAVDTKTCSDFTLSLAKAQFDSGVRNPNVELTISASQGHRGHGTMPEVFEAGAAWIRKRLLA